MADEFTHDFFDKSSKAWRDNKKRKGACWVYKCTYIHSTGKRCNKEIYIVGMGTSNGPTNVFCKQHYKRPKLYVIYEWC